MVAEAVEMIFTLDGISAELAWRRIFDLQLLASIDLCLYGRPVKASQVAATFEASGKNHFDIRGGGFGLRFSPVAQFRHSVLEIQFDFIPSLSECERWVKAFAMPSLISGRRYDVEYERWQNAEDPIEYITQGRSYAGLQTYREPIFGDERIDISRSPGRRVLRNGFVEAVGSTMWLTPEFEMRTGTNLEALKFQNWSRFTPVVERLNRIEVMDRCFTTANGIEAKLQEELRAVLFPAE